MHLVARNMQKVHFSIQIACCCALLDYGAEVNAPEELDISLRMRVRGFPDALITPAAIASHYSNPEVVAYLKSRGGIVE